VNSPLSVVLERESSMDNPIIWKYPNIHAVFNPENYLIITYWSINNQANIFPVAVAAQCGKR
jgi:hypothetical protein